MSFKLPKLNRGSKDDDASSSSLSEAAEMDRLAEQLQGQMGKTSLESAFEKNIDKLAKAASLNPKFIEWFADQWIKSGSSKVGSSEQNVDDTAKGLGGGTKKDRKPSAPVPRVVERDNEPVLVYRDEVFKNWGKTIKYVPSYTFVPKTKIGVVNIVRFAIREGYRVRAAGSRHSWSNVYGKAGEVLISMMNINEAVGKGGFSFPKYNPQDNELERIQFEGTFTAQDGTTKGLVRLGGATTSDHFRKWALSEQHGNWQWMVGALPLLTEITSAGWTQVICHGAGIRHNSLSDLCVEIELVNCKGELQVVKDRAQLKALAGGFGLLGVIVSHVFVVEPLAIAKLSPRKVSNLLAVPPVDRNDVPATKDFKLSKVSDQELERAKTEFETDCNRFFSEWFWFPFQRKSWVNCWDIEYSHERPEYLDQEEEEFQRWQLKLATVFEKTGSRLLPGKEKARLWGALAMALMPSGKMTRASVCDAVHFRRGIHMMPVRNLEVLIEIPPRADGKPDVSICQKAWWMAISLVYEYLPRTPMRTTLEMRVVGGSSTFLSPQFGNKYGTCAIEVVSDMLVPEEEWQEFADDLTKRWGSLTNPVTGKPLRMKPHFAKHWPNVIRGVPVMQYLQDVYRNEIPLFNWHLGEAAKAGGYTLSDALQVFGNDTIQHLIGVPSHHG